MSIDARIGEMFPPLEMVRRMRNHQQLNSKVLLTDSSSPDVIHVGIWMPDFDLRQRGNLPRWVQESVLRQVGAELEKQFEWKIVQTILDPGVGFCYPYLGKTKASLVFSRLVVKDYVAATNATQESSIASACFHQA